MDLQSLVAAHMAIRRRPTTMNASAEDKYYRDQVSLPRRSLRLLGSFATSAGVIVLLVGIA